MSDLEPVRQKLKTLGADSPEDFWLLMTEEAVARVQGAFAFVILQVEDNDWWVFPGQGLDPDELEDFDETPTFSAVMDALGLDGPAFAQDDGGEDDDPLYAVAVPIRVDSHIAGFLAVERTEGEAFTSDEAARLEALTEVFGPVLAQFF